MTLNADCEYSVNALAIAKDTLAIRGTGYEFCVSTRTERDWCFVMDSKVEIVDDIISVDGGNN